MTRLSPDAICIACGGMLIPPELALDFSSPAGTDYVCVKCGRPYRWTKGNPPRLVTVAALDHPLVDENRET